MATRPLRALWLLNHGSARDFDVPMLRRVGVTEVFAPKHYPQDPFFRSASVDPALDLTLTIPAGDLSTLNAADWYGQVPVEAWTVANRHFDLLFFSAATPTLLPQARAHFAGAVLLRAFGLERDKTYTRWLELVQGDQTSDVVALGRRFWFATAYEPLAKVEGELLKGRELLLPLGLPDRPEPKRWEGSDRRVLFICPDIALNSYYTGIYTQFRKDMAGLPYCIAGAQGIRPPDPNVLGYLPQPAFAEQLRQARAMYYHATEPRHVHYHPFEAVRAGVPLVFRAEGLLDALGGRELPGRCETPAAARRLLRRLLDGDAALAERLRTSQWRLLEPMRPDACLPAWRAGIGRALQELELSRAIERAAPARRPRIAVILPAPYRGGTLRAAKALAAAIGVGAFAAGSPVEVVFAHLVAPEALSPESFDDLPAGIALRPYRWRPVSSDEARRALDYAGLLQRWERKDYVVPDDGINDLADCDAWVVVSDRVMRPLLPLRRTAVLVFDYLQRYLPTVVEGLEQGQRFVDFAHQAYRVLVTTDFTARDAIQYAGLPATKLRRLPMLLPPVPALPARVEPSAPLGGGYFVWSTNLAPHKNHRNALEALRVYYEELDGRLACEVTGVDSARLLEVAGGPAGGSTKPMRRLRLRGELAEQDYWRLLRGASFVWHPARVDNGTFCVVEAAEVGVPALASDYPAMREMDSTLGLGLAWMDALQPRDMAAALKRMESDAAGLQARLPTGATFDAHRRLSATAYWAAVKELL